MNLGTVGRTQLRRRYLPTCFACESLTNTVSIGSVISCNLCRGEERPRIYLPVSVACSHESLLWSPQCGKCDTIPWVAHPGCGSQRYETYVGVWRSGSLRHDGQELLNYHGVCQVVDSKVVLETVFAEAWRNEHNAGVAPIIWSNSVLGFSDGDKSCWKRNDIRGDHLHEYIEAAVGEFCTGSFNRRQRCHVHLYESCSNRRVGILNLSDQRFPSLSISAAKVDVGGIMFGKLALRLSQVQQCLRVVSYVVDRILRTQELTFGYKDYFSFEGCNVLLWVKIHKRF